VTFTWFDPPFRPEPPHSNQAYGICFTEAGMIVLGAWDGDGERYWNLPGGGVEPGETLEDCLVRPEDFLQTLSWGSAPTAAIILAAGLRAEAERRQG
jgi:NUDIX domain